MRRLFLVFGGLAFFWACAVTSLVLQASSQTGMAVSAVVTGIPLTHPPVQRVVGASTAGSLHGRFG